MMRRFLLPSFFMPRGSGHSIGTLPFFSRARDGPPVTFPFSSDRETAILFPFLSVPLLLPNRGCIRRDSSFFSASPIIIPFFFPSATRQGLFPGLAIVNHKPPFFSSLPHSFFPELCAAFSFPFFPFIRLEMKNCPPSQALMPFPFDPN